MNSETVSVWDKFVFRAKASPFAYFDLVITKIISFATVATALADGIYALFTFIYNSFPPIIERIANAYLVVSEFITNQAQKSQQVVTQMDGVVSNLDASQVGDGGSTIWDIVKYCANVDALTDSLNFLVSVGWLWIFISVAVLLVATSMLVFSGSVWVTRRVIAVCSAGLIDV